MPSSRSRGLFLRFYEIKPVRITEFVHLQNPFPYRLPQDSLPSDLDSPSRPVSQTYIHLSYVDIPVTRREELEAFFANRARPTGPRSLPDTNQPIERQGRPVEDPPQPVDNNDRPVGNHREPTNRPGTALDSTGAAASALPSTTDVASLFANAFRPTGITARPEHTPFIDPDIANNEPRLVLDPALTALSSNNLDRSVDRSVTTRSGNSTLAVQQQLTTGNLRSLDPTINRRENSIEEIPEEQRSVEIITG
ncbi:hypothetical protein MJO28_004056 [Puccinia striiformis f. sp. tritici]|uniref:Uncharacterized protein n=1 Tax=Puccinia striiformis f. sp. tritici TaxID=168172 RepID=A0ACC0ENI1_9BASI|nr:hypothetical protein MJO28_004056 [Puccinia striiformis f. sp. tritici]